MATRSFPILGWLLEIETDDSRLIEDGLVKVADNGQIVKFVK